MNNILKYQNPSSPLFNPHKIIENVPAREWGPRKINEDGTITEGNGTKFSRAPFQYWGKKGLGSQNEKLARDLVSEFDQMRSENPDYNYILDKNYQSYDDAINYLNHLEGLKKYLQLPYDTGLLMESEYKPTRLQGTNEKTYKFKSSTVPGYWDDVVDDMVIGEYDKNQYYDQSLNEFTAYRDRDEKGDFVSIYDEWDYNPAVRGGNKKLNKVVDSVTGGKPFVIYDRVYLDDHYNIPEEARGNPFITPAVVTANAKHENGGVLKAQEGTPYGLPGGAPSYMQVQPFSPVGIALNQAKAMAKTKREQHLPPGVKEVVGPNGKKVAIRTEQPLQPLEQSIAEWLPGTGDVAEVGYIADDVKNGRYGSAALAAAMVALPGNVGKIFRKSDIPTSKLTEAERLGIPKGERSNPKALDNPQYWGYEQWNEKYNAAVRTGNWEEAQRLRDLHFMSKAPDTKVIDEKGMPRHMYHGSGRTNKGKPRRFTTFNGVNRDLEHRVEDGITQNHWRLSKPNDKRMNNYHTPAYDTALMYSGWYRTNIHDNYLNVTNPFTYNKEKLHEILLNAKPEVEMVFDVNTFNYVPKKVEVNRTIPDWAEFRGRAKRELMKLGYDGLYIPQYHDSYGAFVSPSQFKSADPITWDGKGEMIPIVKRDNFRNLDTRYNNGGKL